MVAMDFVCDFESIDEDIPVEAKLSFFNETRHMYGEQPSCYLVEQPWGFTIWVSSKP